MGRYGGYGGDMVRCGEMWGEDGEGVVEGGLEQPPPRTPWEISGDVWEICARYGEIWCTDLLKLLGSKHTQSRLEGLLQP